MEKSTVETAYLQTALAIARMPPTQVTRAYVPSWNRFMVVSMKIGIVHIRTGTSRDIHSRHEAAAPIDPDHHMKWIKGKDEPCRLDGVP